MRFSNRDNCRITMKKLILSLVLTGIAFSVHAIEEIEVCGKYQRADSSWSHGYKLTGFKLDGSELGEALKRPYDFPSYQTYFLLVWEKGGYTYYKVNSWFPPVVWETTKDQNGRKWRLQNGWSLCY